MVSTAAETTTSDRLPVGVYLLGFSLFAMGSAEFLLAGVLPAVAGDLGVSLSSAGLLITAFALGVVIGGPPFAVLSLRWPRRTALVVTQAVFAASIAIGLLGDYEVLLISRAIAGIAYAGFFAVASVTAIGLVTPDRNARASGVVVSGLSVAMVAGGPAGTLLSHFTEWRGGFWAVVVLTAAGMIGCVLGLPAVDRGGPAPSVSRELATMRKPALWRIYAITILTTAAYMITFNYLAAMLADITAMPAVWIPAVLALFGVGAFAGLSAGGRISDRRPHFALLTGASAIVVLSVVLALAMPHAWAVVPLVFLLGIAAFVLNPALYGRVFAIASDAPTLAGATTVSAFQLGISITPVLAGATLAQGASLTSVCLFGAVLAAAAIPLVLLDRK
ncbi:MFS transporter, DHA1 family, chloramphenicol resistance protein [Saccharopolyspora antimicrobica]|uniref:DHA1 family chloramphenicol resistance protein-like MFS transporter n=1 Tax=Saccharopolyspora antimicrobica TaxID=455193 RepID=A0A1I5F143_9PSEU|nr:MFS transporter [Saccharopolyspora antimicrobica]RKT83614.1 DHA1 family chloramphenicol resistance protein-like MFS transporter [Saccharopolyspora antimicrobica]SFO17051.1 MFS transporter, DHA1 family, chloramphenicol resistance protein [Saccharopolyspora antimicrobica]